MLNWAESEGERLLGWHVLSRKRWAEGRDGRREGKTQRACRYHFLVGGDKVQGDGAPHLRAYVSRLSWSQCGFQTHRCITPTEQEGGAGAGQKVEC